MGLMDRFKKKTGEKYDDPDGIGGIIDTDTILEKSDLTESDSEDEESALTMADLERSITASGLEETIGSTKETDGETGDKNEAALSGLDIFTSEELEDDDERGLADKLPEVDINELLRECQEIVSRIEEVNQ